MENPVAPTTIVYDDSGRLYWGYHAQELLRTQPFRFEHNSIDMIKLGLWASDTPAGGEVLDRIATLSCKKDISTIFGELLCKIVEEAKDQLPHRLNRMDRAAEVRNADVNLFLCYPYMSNLETKRAYQDAAWQSGVTSVRLVSAPNQTAASITANKRRKPCEKIITVAAGHLRRIPLLVVYCTNFRSPRYLSLIAELQAQQHQGKAMIT